MEKNSEVTFSIGNWDRKAELGRLGTEGLRNEDAKPQEGGREDKGDWVGEDEFTSTFSATNNPQFPIKLSPLPLISDVKGKTVTAKPRRSDLTRPKYPSLSSSKEGLHEATSPLLGLHKKMGK